LLPDFAAPPLDEVVIGVQFASPTNFTSLDVNDVWNLYKDEFPVVLEQPRIAPQFETFGGHNPQPGFNFEFGPPPLHIRYWFESRDNSHLIQFQDDRFLLNWRNRATGVQYPRHPIIAENFRNYLDQLRALFEQKFSSTLLINQAEITYINVIHVDEYSEIGHWINMLDPRGSKLETMNMVLAEVVNGDKDRPIARFIHELQSVVTTDGKQKAIRLSLVFRGTPQGTDIDSAMEFITLGRERIVNRFCDITTTEAHRAWKRR
jgi:uncharacterized protein (TIGR04255 family)